MRSRPSRRRQRRFSEATDEPEFGLVEEAKIRWRLLRPFNSTARFAMHPDLCSQASMGRNGNAARRGVTVRIGDDVTDAP
jgi:hypothetical protein